MTGVGLAAGPTEIGGLRIEVRTVNGRSLVQKLRLPSVCAGFDAAIEAEIQKRVCRGTVTVVVERLDGSKVLGLAALEHAATELGQMAKDIGAAPPTLADVVSWANAAARQEAVTSRPLPPQFAALLGQALDELERHRVADGDATIAAMNDLLVGFERDVDAAVARAPHLVDQYRDRLLQRVNDFMQQHLPDPVPAVDLVREVAIYSDRVDVAEELQRLRAHIVEFRALLARDGEVGRRLDFLLQELLRETNTLGSKSPDTELSHTVVAMKSCLDRLREQVANLQ